MDYKVLNASLKYFYVFLWNSGKDDSSGTENNNPRPLNFEFNGKFYELWPPDIMKKAHQNFYVQKLKSNLYSRFEHKF